MPQAMHGQHIAVSVLFWPQMRTSLNIEDEAFYMLKKCSEDRNVSLGRAASDLIHRGAQSLPKFKTRNGWALLDVPSGSPPVTNQMIDEWEKEDLEQEYQRAISPRR